MNKIKSILATVAAIAATACSSNETPVPENPEIPIGYEVPTEVIYEVNPRFFGENDCLKGVTAQLSRISDMGCDILWVMPVYETGELKGIGSPYCVRDYKAVNARYGTMADMKDLVDAAHAKGMKVILDWVANHTAWDCAWITEHPNWYKKDAGGNIIAPNGWNDVAQLDYNNSDMRAAMKDAMFYWVDRLSIDGFRCDYADGVPHDFWSSVISDLRASHPDMIMLAETSNSAYYADGFDMIYDWNSAENPQVWLARRPKPSTRCPTANPYSAMHSTTMWRQRIMWRPCTAPPKGCALPTSLRRCSMERP